MGMPAVQSNSVDATATWARGAAAKSAVAEGAAAVVGWGPERRKNMVSGRGVPLPDVTCSNTPLELVVQRWRGIRGSALIRRHHTPLLVWGPCGGVGRFEGAAVYS